MKQQRKWSFGTNKVMVEQSPTLLKSKTLRWYEKADILFQMSSYLTTAVGFALIFAYIQFPLAGGLIILLSPYVPIVIANVSRGKHGIFKNFVITTMVFSALLPTLFLGTLTYFAGRTEGYRITSKANSRNLPFIGVVRRNLFGILTGILFFTVLPIAYPDIPAYLQQFPPSVIAMLSIIVAPFLLNYSKRLGGSSMEAGPSRLNALRLMPRFALLFALAVISLGPKLDHSQILLAIESIVPSAQENLISPLNSNGERHYYDPARQSQAAFWDLKRPVLLKKGERVTIRYDLRGTDVMAVQLKPVGEPAGEKDDLIVVHHAAQQSVTVVVPSDRLLGRIVIHYGPKAYGWLGGSMTAKLRVASVHVSPPFPSVRRSVFLPGKQRILNSNA
jgi:hypothetical protein